MSYATKLKFAGGTPFEPEQERDDISHEEMELLEQDDVYQKLAELRWLVDEAEAELHTDNLIEKSNADRALFTAVATKDAPLQQTVDRYVAQWLAAHRVDSGADGNEEVAE